MTKSIFIILTLAGFASGAEMEVTDRLSVDGSSLFKSTAVFSGSVGIGTTQPGAALDVTSTTNGFLPPRMTTAQRNVITTPIPESLIIYNITTQCYEGYNAASSQWVSFGCIGCQLPGSFSASAASGIGKTTFSANWTASSGATAYYLDVSTANNFASFVPGYNNTNVGNVTTHNITTALICQTPYYYRVRASNSCSTTANSNTITQNTSDCFTCGESMVVAHTAGTVAPVTKTVTYGTVRTNLSGASKCWITQNLGADHQASSATDGTEASAGWYWQFNRMQGYKHDGTTLTPGWTITSIDDNSDWTSANDPCALLLGSGWRLPTSAEWSNANGAPQNWTNYNDTYASVLKIHAAGLLLYNDGSLFNRNTYGSYWSSTQASATGGWDLFPNSSHSIMNSDVKAYGFSVRCLKD